MSAGAAAESESARARGRADELRRRADRLEQRAEKFEQGRVGELAVSAALRRLTPAGFAVIDDVRWPGTSKANIDHLVYGPSGMFVVDAKNWTGDVRVKAGVLRQNGYGRSRETDKVHQMAEELRTHLGASVGRLRPIVCLVGQPNVLPEPCGHTLVVGVERLAAWVFTQPAIWPPEHVAALTRWLPFVLEPAVAGAAPIQVAAAPPRTVPPGLRAPLSSPTATGFGAGTVSSTVPSGGRHRAPERASGLYGWLRGR